MSLHRQLFEIIPSSACQRIQTGHDLHNAVTSQTALGQRKKLVNGILETPMTLQKIWGDRWRMDDLNMKAINLILMTELQNPIRLNQDTSGNSLNIRSTVLYIPFDFPAWTEL